MVKHITTVLKTRGIAQRNLHLLNINILATRRTVISLNPQQTFWSGPCPLFPFYRPSQDLEKLITCHFLILFSGHSGHTINAHLYLFLYLSLHFWGNPGAKNFERWSRLLSADCLCHMPPSLPPPFNAMIHISSSLTMSLDSSVMSILLSIKIIP